MFVFFNFNLIALHFGKRSMFDPEIVQKGVVSQLLNQIKVQRSLSSAGEW